jgi:hypothetical protein
MLNPLQIRLCDEDRDTYGGAEWLPLHAGLFVEVRASKLADWERQTGLKVLDLCQADFDRKAIDKVRAVAWYARQLAGLAEPVFADFDPLILKAEMADLPRRPEGDDADPPAPSSAGTSAEA